MHIAAITDEQVRYYRQQGYVVVPQLFDAATVEEMIGHYMAMRAEGPKPGDFGGTDDRPEDPTHQYPRLINMHRWDEKSGRWAMRDDVRRMVAALIEDEPVLNQTMLYFKPPGGRGQALHQDQQYITIQPLIGLWVALERSDEAVGQMIVVPGSHRGVVLEVEAADTAVSFTSAQAILPVGTQEVGLEMEPGDGLFFDGKTVHGSYANNSEDRWRRTFICHYVGENAESFESAQGTHVTHI